MKQNLSDYTAQFNIAFNIVLSHEGGYVNDEFDEGGQTKFGISQAAYPELDIKSLSVDDAKQIYLNDYYTKSKCDLLPFPIAIALFDACINHGVTHGVKALQDATKVKSDGVIGNVTISAINNWEPGLLLSRFLARRAQKYHYICQDDSTQERFYQGWTKRLFNLQNDILIAWVQRLISIKVGG